MALVVLQRLQATSAGHGLQDVAISEIERCVLAGAESSGGVTHFVQDRLELGRADHSAEHAANRTLLLPQPLVAPRELL